MGDIRSIESNDMILTCRYYVIQVLLPNMCRVYICQHFSHKGLCASVSNLSNIFPPTGGIHKHFAEAVEVGSLINNSTERNPSWEAKVQKNSLISWNQSVHCHIHKSRCFSLPTFGLISTKLIKLTNNTPSNSLSIQKLLTSQRYLKDNSVT